mgnify:CR=1 FL=1
MVAEVVKVCVFKQKTAYEVRLSRVGSEMCIRERSQPMGAFQATPAVSRTEDDQRIFKQRKCKKAILVFYDENATA